MVDYFIYSHAVSGDSFGLCMTRFVYVIHEVAVHPTSITIPIPITIHHRHHLSPSPSPSPSQNPKPPLYKSQHSSPLSQNPYHDPTSLDCAENFGLGFACAMCSFRMVGLLARGVAGREQGLRGVGVSGLEWEFTTIDYSRTSLGSCLRVTYYQIKVSTVTGP